jgi:hypothetical protein
MKYFIYVVSSQMLRINDPRLSSRNSVSEGNKSRVSGVGVGHYDSNVDCAWYLNRLSHIFHLQKVWGLLNWENQIIAPNSKTTWIKIFNDDTDAIIKDIIINPGDLPVPTPEPPMLDADTVKDMIRSYLSDQLENERECLQSLIDGMDDRDCLYQLLNNIKSRNCLDMLIHGDAEVRKQLERKRRDMGYPVSVGVQR